MSNELSVYKQLISGTSECLSVIKREIGMKTTCIPFAVKLTGAMKDLKIRTEQDALNAANTLLSGLQTMMQGGIIAEDYDKIDFVKRGNVIVPSARVEAFYRAAARKGYRITDTIIPVPQDDSSTTYFRENFFNGVIVYTLEDRRFNPDRAITGDRLRERYFSKFLCRLDVHSVAENKRIVMTVCEMSADDMLAVASASEQGLYQSEWKKIETPYGIKNRKILTDKPNRDGFWEKWTGEMVNKTIIRRALKRIKEVLPELQEAIYAFDQDEYKEPETQEEPTIEIPVQTVNVDFNHLTPEEKADCKELYELWNANPKLADDKVLDLKEMFSKGMEEQDVINAEYAAITVLCLSKTKWDEIGGLFSEKNQAAARDACMGTFKRETDRKQ